jgi:hypothetical protein
MYIEGLEYDLLRAVLEHINMTFDHVPTPVERFVGAMVLRAVGDLILHLLVVTTD